METILVKDYLGSTFDLAQDIFGEDFWRIPMPWTVGANYKKNSSIPYKSLFLQLFNGEDWLETTLADDKFAEINCCHSELHNKVHDA